jgi:putative tryptophan/tyrosine transport system substrate-binding protein
MKRREFISLLGGVAAWPLAARAQQLGGPKRVGLLAPFSDDHDPLVQRYLSAFKQRLHELGWIETRNIRVDVRFTGQNGDRIRTGAEELIALSPDLIVVWANPAVAILRNTTQNIPIVFVTVSDPVGSGFVTNLARPGGNITGFENFQSAIGGKWLEVLRDIAPEVRRIAFVHSPDTSHQDLIISLAARLHLPAMYPFRYFSTNGGLVSYGFDTVEQHRGAASYVDRILKGERPGDLPVQAPTKYELVINLKTAKAQSLTIPPGVLAIADEVIE